MLAAVKQREEIVQWLLTSNPRADLTIKIPTDNVSIHNFIFIMLESLITFVFVYKLLLLFVPFSLSDSEYGLFWRQ